MVDDGVTGFACCSFKPHDLTVDTEEPANGPEAKLLQGSTNYSSELDLEKDSRFPVEEEVVS